MIQRMNFLGIAVLAGALLPLSAFAADPDIPKELGKGIDGKGILEQNAKDGKAVPDAKGKPADNPKASSVWDESQPVLVTLRSGGRVEGILLPSSRKGETRVQVDGGGIFAFDAKQIYSIDYKSNAASEFKAKQAKTDPKDPKALLELALWAKDHGLRLYAEQTARKIIALDPDNQAARALLGHEKIGGKWLTHDDAMKAKGFVEFRGSWIKAEQRDKILADEEAARAEAERLRQEEEKKKDEEELPPPPPERWRHHHHHRHPPVRI